MKTEMNHGEDTGEGGSGLRTAVSLFLVVHLFLVGIAVWGNYAPSPLVAQILAKFKPYTRLLNFDLNSTPYHLTHAEESDVDHRVEILPEVEADWIVLPASGFRGNDAYKRYQRLAAYWALQAQGDGDPAQIANAIGTYFAQQKNIRPKQVRCRRHFLQSRDELESGTPARRDPNDNSYFAVVYAANTIVSDTGHVDIVRIDEASQVAQPIDDKRTPPRTEKSQTEKSQTEKSQTEKP